MMAEHVISSDDSRATLEVAGGKGASLAKLARAGLLVPDGFHVTTAAYREFVEANELQNHVLAALEAVNPLQPATLEAAGDYLSAGLAGNGCVYPVQDAAAHGDHRPGLQASHCRPGCDDGVGNALQPWLPRPRMSVCAGWMLH
jgi:hypothetical protein